MPPSPSFRPDPAIRALGDDFYDRVEPAEFPQALLRFRNQRAAEHVGLGALTDAEWIDHFARFAPLHEEKGGLALRYHGHQFRVYNPDIGDGRGFLFAQLRDGQGRLLDLGTKGSGTTPYSRFGDGRLTLKGGVRELLATEMLEALGVVTSRTFSLIETGEALERNDEPSPTRSAVLVRLQHSHIRIGTFQRLAYLDEARNIEKLAAWCLQHYYPDAPEDGGAPAARLLAQIVPAAARLAASYIAAGFVHGVLNTDNIAITAESFDYGPWRFTPFWDGGFTAAYFDHAGLYSFARQPEAIQWNLVQLARALRAVAEPEPLTAALETFPEHFRRALRDHIFARLGILATDADADLETLVALETALAARTVEIDRFFFDWRGGRRRAPSPADPAYAEPPFEVLAERLSAYAPAPGALDHPYWSDPAPCSMHIDEVEALWRRIDEADDWSALHDKVAAVRRMGEALSSLNGPLTNLG
jgi:serine/tyrosine/threonine adenylyltransferase